MLHVDGLCMSLMLGCSTFLDLSETYPQFKKVCCHVSVNFFNKSFKIFVLKSNAIELFSPKLLRLRMLVSVQNVNIFQINVWDPDNIGMTVKNMPPPILFRKNRVIFAQPLILMNVYTPEV